MGLHDDTAQSIVMLQVFAMVTRSHGVTIVLHLLWHFKGHSFRIQATLQIGTYKHLLKLALLSSFLLSPTGCFLISDCPSNWMGYDVRIYVAKVELLLLHRRRGCHKQFLLLQNHIDLRLLIQRSHLKFWWITHRGRGFFAKI